MTRVLRIPLTIAAACVLSLLSVIPALAAPVLPSSFYGTLKVRGANLPDGTLVQALVGGQVYAETLSQTYQGDSVYTLDIRGDDTDTSAQDGGREGDTVQFKVGGLLAEQTGIWHGGTNVRLNLTVAASATLPAPKPSRTPLATQTAMEIEAQPSETPALDTEATPLPTDALASPSEMPSSMGQPALAATSLGSAPTEVQQAQPSDSTAVAPKADSKGLGGLRAAGILLIVVGAAGGGIWWARSRK